MLDLENLAAGTLSKGYLSPKLGYPVKIPYFILKGAKPGPTVLVTAGVHGAEYASIDAAYRVTKLDPKTLSGTVVILPIISTPAFTSRSIYINPIDYKNLNRLFPGMAEGTFGEKLVYWLTEEFICKADAYIDLHGGDMIEALTPFTIYQAGHTSSHELAKAFGIELLVASDSEIMSFTAGARQDIPSILAEASGQGLWLEAEVERLRLGVERCLIHLGLLEGELEPKPHKDLSEFAWLRSEHEGLWYPYAVAGDRVKKNQVVGEVKSLLGEPLQQAISSIDGIVLFSVSSLAINADDPLLGIGA
ncbi:MAG: succinylglutamate desuccinylase/aspartoacylase family protein [Trueperaceae bacterium]|nr:succinylglutamate desuccinylase/aspartoacylase family protein [Trueperaceae bacterium]